MVHDDANCNIIWHPPFFAQKTGFTLSSTKGCLILIWKKRHIQSVSLYLWHKEEYDFDFVMQVILIVEGKITDTL